MASRRRLSVLKSIGLKMRGGQSTVLCALLLFGIAQSASITQMQAMEWFSQGWIRRCRAYIKTQLGPRWSESMRAGTAIVVGGSVGGLFIGALLQQQGWKVEIYERSATGLAGKGAGFVPQQEVSDILREIGREDVLQSGVVANERIFLDRTGEIQGLLQTPQAQLSWDLLFQAWRDQISSQYYHLGSGVDLVSTAQDFAEIHLSDGPVHRADLVIGADGIGSVVRPAVAPNSHPQYAGYAAFRGLSTERELPKQSADMVSDRFTFFDAPGSQFLGYTVAGADGSIQPGERRYNWVWYRQLSSEEFAKALESNDGQSRSFSAPRGGLSAKTEEELRAAARVELPDVFSEIVVKEKSPFLQGIFDYEAPVMYRGRAVLLGDAAFVVRPHTAMGIAKAAADAMELRDALIEEASVGTAFHRYNAKRMIVGSQIASYGQRLGERLQIHAADPTRRTYEEDEGM
jgi:2-polyprenyl-6-methoxyphenol hydroxylase-like FAD-dependent oxidoreductase